MCVLPTQTIFAVIHKRLFQVPTTLHRQEIWYCLHMAWFIHNVQGQNTHFHWRITEIVCCGKLWLVIIQLRCWRDCTAKRITYVMFSHAASIVVRLRNVRFSWSMDLSNLTVFFVLIRIFALRIQLIQSCVLKY